MAEGKRISGHNAGDVRAAAERALVKAEAAQGEVAAAAEDNVNALRQQRDALRGEAKAAREEAAEASKRQRQAEGRVKAARSRARNLRELPDWQIGHGDDERAAHAERIRKAEAAIERAEAKAAQAKGESKTASTRVGTVTDAEKVNRDALRNARDAQAQMTQAAREGEQQRTAAVRGGEGERAAIRERAAQAEGQQTTRAGVTATKRAEQEKTAAVARGARDRVQLTERERRMIRSAVTGGSVRFDETLVPEQVQTARGLAQRGLLEQSYRTQATNKKNGSIGFRATGEGISAVDDQGDLRAMRSEAAQREIEGARQKLRRVRRDDQKKLYGDLVTMYEGDIDAYQRFQAEQAAAGPERFKIAEHNTRRGINYQVREVTQTGSNPVTGLIRTYEEAQRLLKVANEQGAEAARRADAPIRAKAERPVTDAAPTVEKPAAKRLRLPKGYRIIEGEDPEAPHELVAPGGRLVSATDDRRSLYATAHGDVVEQRMLAEAEAKRGAEAVEKGEQRKTTAVQQGAARRNAARKQEGQVVGGNTAEFERRVRENADILARGLDPEGRRHVEALQRPTPPAEQQRALAELEAARAAVERPGTDLIRHPTLNQYPQRETLTGRAFRPAGAVAERNISGGNRSPLADLESQLLHAQAVQDESQRQLRRMRGAFGRGQASEGEVLRTEAAHRENVANVDELRRQRNALRSDIEATVARTRAQNAATEALLADARARGRQPIPDSRALVPLARTGTALVPTGVSRDDPFSTLTAAERAALNGAGIGNPPRPPRPPAPPTGPGPTEPPHPPRVQYDEALADRAARVQREYASAVRDSDMALRRWDAQLGIADQSMRRHGTFTTEFIDAARRGDVAYREWGWQIGAAATKFGAWTAAGAGIYGAITAVQKVGQGALDSASGVASVRRTLPNLNSGQAQRQFRQLSTDFAVPISDASDAMMRMGAVFKTQEGAFIGARTALMAFRTGEVDVNTATQQLTQIQAGMGASAQDLADIFDRLNYVQNNYGARIPDLLNGTSKLSAAWRQAGGDADYLVAIITAMNRTAGVSGDQAATILGRTIGNVARPSSAATLQKYGIAPDQTHIEDTIEATIARAHQPGTTPQQIQELAHALAGGTQFQRQWVAILQDPKILHNVLGDEKAGKYHNASQNELNQVMKTWQMRIAELGSQLGNLGSNLAQGGFVTSLGAAATLLTAMLKTVNGLLEVFNLLPQPVKTLAASVVTVIALLRLARRFGIGGAFAGRLGGVGDRVAPFLNEAPGRTARRSISKGLNDAVGAAEDDYEKTAKAARNAQAVRRRALRSQDVETREANRRMALPSTHPDHYTPDEGNARIVASNQRYLRSLDRAAEANLDGVAATEQLRSARRAQAAYERSQANGPRGQRNERALEFGRRNGLWGPPSLPREYPEAEHVQRFMGMSPTGTPLFASGGVRMRLDASDLQRQAQQALTAAEGSVISSRRFTLQPSAAGLLAARSTAVQEAGAARARRFGATGALGRLAGASGAVTGAVLGLGGATGTSSRYMGPSQVAELRRGARLQTTLAAAQIAFGQASRQGLDGARQAVNQVRPRLAQMKIGMGNLATEFAGLIDPAQLLLAGVLALPAVILAIKSALDNDIKRMNELARSPTSADDKKLLMQQLSEASNGGTTFGEYWTNLSTPDTPWGALGALFGVGKNPLTKDRQNAAKGLLDAEKKLEEAQKRARQEGRDVPGMTGDEIDHDVNQATARYQAGRSTIDAAIAAVQKGLREIEKSTTMDDTEKADKKEDLLNQLAQLNKEKQDAIQSAIDAENDALQALVQSGAATSGQLAEYMQRMSGLVRQLQGSTDPAEMQKYANARQGLLDALTNAGKSDLDAALANARTPAQVRKAYRDYARAGSSAAKQARGAAVRPGYESLPGGFLGGLRNDVGGMGPDAIQQRTGEVLDPKLLAQVKAAQRQRQQEIFEAQRELSEAQTTVRAGRTEAGLPRLELQLRAVHRQVVGAIKAYGRYNKTTLDLIAQQQDAQAAVIQQQFALIQAEADYRAAGHGGDQVGAGAERISGLQQQLASARAHPNVEGVGDRGTVLSILTQLREARTAQAETIRQQATELIDSQYALRESLNDDPVYVARLEAQKAAATLARGGFQTPAERNQAAAEANNARRAAQDAAVQAQIESIDFDVEIGKKTTEQQIAAYERLLKTHKMGQQQKKELERQIARLRHGEETGSESFSLDVGNIRLPSVYEVHRAIKEGRDARQKGMTINNSPSVTVNLAPGDDGSTVVRTLDRYLGTSARSAMRASADIGV